MAQWASSDERNSRKSQKNSFRKWEPVEEENDNGDGKGFKFTIMSYNVLAQCLLESHSYLYRQCYPEHLEWEVRAARLYDEIRNLEPDILCLQEVQASHIESFFSKFENIGYCGVFKKKTGTGEDGCAIYYRHSMFQLEDHITVQFYQPALPVLNRDNVGLVVKLRPRPALPPVVVATTHLLYNPKRADVRLAQMQLFLAEIDRFAYYQDGTCSGHYPIILAGDLNSPPESAVAKLLSGGHVRALRGDSDWRRIGVTDSCQHLSVYLNRPKGIHTDDSMLKIYNSERRPPVYNEAEGSNKLLEAIKGQGTDVNDEYSYLFNGPELSHGLKLTSVYEHQKWDGSLEGTALQNEWVTVDYIFYSRCSGLKPSQRLRLPRHSECHSIGPLPNEEHPSDHFALAATFELAPSWILPLPSS